MKQAKIGWGGHALNASMRARSMHVSESNERSPQSPPNMCTLRDEANELEDNSTIPPSMVPFTKFSKMGANTSRRPIQSTGNYNILAK